MKNETRNKSHNKIPQVKSVSNANRIMEIFSSHAGASSVIKNAAMAQEMTSRNASEKLPYISLFYNLDEIFSKITHDSKNYLGSLKGYSSLLAKELQLGEIANRNAIRYSGKLSDNIDTMNEYFNSLAVYRIKGAFKKEEISLNTLVIETMRAFKHFNKSDVKVEVNQNLDGRFKIHKELIKRIILNLLINAYESKFKGVRISASIEENKFGKGTKPGMVPVMIKIVDNGCGIETSKINYVWTPFYSTKPRHIGLGLTYIKMAAAVLGAEINLKSVPGRGTAALLKLDMQGG